MTHLPKLSLHAAAMLLLLVALLAVGCGRAPGAATQRAAPELVGTGEWINSPPLTMAGLRGKVVLVEFWAFQCINCVHVAPYVAKWHAQFHDDGLVVVGVHTPEFDEERSVENLRAAVQRLGIRHAVVQDNEYETWNAYGNRFWPALYLVDRQGNIVYRHYGEGRYAETEQRIQQALAAKGG